MSPVDPRIPMMGVGAQPVQPFDPMQTLAQVSAIKNQQLQREEAQQRIALAQEGLQLRQQEAERKAKEEEGLRAGQAAVAPALQGGMSRQEVLSQIAQIPDPVIRSHAIKAATDFYDKDSIIQQRASAAGKDDADVRRLQIDQLAGLGRSVRDVGNYSPAAIEFAFKIAGTSKMLNKETLDLYYQKWLENPGEEASKQLIDGLITAGEQNVTLNRGDVRTSPTGTVIARGAEPEEKEPSEFDAYLIGPYARSLGKQYKSRGEAYGDLTAAQVERAREQFRLDQRLSPTVVMQQGTQAGFDKLPIEYRMTIGRALNDLKPAQRQNWMRSINDAYENGQVNQVPGMVMQAAIESESPDDQRVIMGRRQMGKSMTELAATLKEVPTGFIRGTAEDTMRAIGTTTDPKLVRLKARIQSSLANYRRAYTGAAFSEKESAEYTERFPQYKNDMPVNMAVIQGFLDDLNGNDQVYWETKLGPDGAKLMGAIKPVDVLAEPAAAAEPKEGDTRPLRDGGEATFKGGKWIKTR